MLDKKEYLLICLAEECAEIQQAVSKCLRFGLHDEWKSHATPVENLNIEINDLLGVIKMLKDEGVLEKFDGNQVSAKIGKVKYFMEYSRNRNRLNMEYSE